MRTGSRWALGFLSVSLLVGGWASAGEPADVQKQIDELKAKIEKLEAKKDSSTPSSGEKKGSWTDKVTLFGDFRYRHEDIEEPGREVDLADRNRDRIRLRVGLKAKVNDEVDLTARLATGTTTDPVSTNQTLDDHATKKTVVLDLAFFDYHPQALKDAGVPLNILGGKFEVPFVRPGGSDLIWDGDLTPEGGAIKVAPKFGDAVELIGVLGGFWVNERAATGADPIQNGEDAALFGVQAALKFNFEEKGKIYAMAGVGYFNYTHTQGKAPYGAAFGNNVNSDGTYESAFEEVEGLLEVGFPVLDVPVVLYVDYVVNSGAEKVRGETEDTGYMLGVTVGKLKEQWDWAVGYNYRELERDAVLGIWADSDAGGGGTDVRGHKFSAHVVVLKNVTVGATFLQNEENISDNTTTDKDADYRRLQLDISLKF